MKKDALCRCFEQILSLIDEKLSIDQKNAWSHGSATYFSEIHKELEEVAHELKNNRSIYLEDELGDVLWDYLNLLKNLDKEDRIDMSMVFERCYKKYTERLSHENWHVVKERQKMRLQEEQSNITHETLTKNRKFSSIKN